jgi:hypothetical protein
MKNKQANDGVVCILCFLGWPVKVVANGNNISNEGVVGLGYQKFSSNLEIIQRNFLSTHNFVKKIIE